MLGLHLVRRKKISAEQLCELLEEQEKSRTPIGRLCLELKLLSVAQVMTILSDQATSRERFGSIAIRLGLLTSEEVSEVLTEQQARIPQLEELLLTRNWIEPGELTDEIDQYRGLDR